MMMMIFDKLHLKVRIKLLNDPKVIVPHMLTRGLQRCCYSTVLTGVGCFSYVITDQEKRTFVRN